MNRAVIGTGFPVPPLGRLQGLHDELLRVAERTAGIRRPLRRALTSPGLPPAATTAGNPASASGDIAAGGTDGFEAGGPITDLFGRRRLGLNKGCVCAGTPRISPSSCRPWQAARRRRSPEGLYLDCTSSSTGDRFVVRPFFITGARIRARLSLKIP